MPSVQQYISVKRGSYWLFSIFILLLLTSDFIKHSIQKQFSSGLILWYKSFSEFELSLRHDLIHWKNSPPTIENEKISEIYDCNQLFHIHSRLSSYRRLIKCIKFHFNLKLQQSFLPSNPFPLLTLSFISHINYWLRVTVWWSRFQHNLNFQVFYFAQFDSLQLSFFCLTEF